MGTGQKPEEFTNVSPSGLPKPLWELWSWQTLGRCRSYPPHVFFPDRVGHEGLRRREEEAKSICRQCPVLLACREHALKTPEMYGVWGGMTARERAELL